MKKETKRLLPIWIIVAIVGILFLIIGIVLSFPKWSLWLAGSLCFGTTILWMLLYYLIPLLKSKPKKTNKISGDSIIYERVFVEINEAISRYLQSVKRKGLLKRSALYERPWFLVCGPQRSGKSQLLLGSGLHFPLKYPSEKDGVLLDEGSGISWNFGNNTVYADMPGLLMEDGNRNEWRSTVNAIHSIRPERTIDGVVVVLGADTISNASPRAIKNIGESIRSRLDELIAAWGIEFPVYLIISKSDKIPGFKEIFHDPAGKWDEQILGATLSGDQQQGLPRTAFSEEFEYLCSSLRDMRLRVLAQEKTEEKRRLICRFVIHFEGLRQKLGDLVSELFKPSSYEGKPVFRGFYFSSCFTFLSEDTFETNSFGSISQTIIDHPLNPQRAAVPQKSQGNFHKKTDVKSYFTHALFRDIVPSGLELVKKTQKTTRREKKKQYAMSALIVFVTALFGWYVFICAQNSRSLNKRIKNEVFLAKKKTISSADAYERLGRMGDLVYELKKLEENGIPLSMGMGMYRGDTIFTEIKKMYFEKISKLIVKPSMNYFEYQINHYTDTYKTLTGDSYNELYEILKGYLSISEAIADKFELIDTVSLSMIVFDAIKSSILTSENKPRLSEKVEMVLHKNISLYFSYLTKGTYPLIQEEQHLVSKARSRLRRLPDAQVLYKTMLTHITPESTPLSLDDILERTGSEGFLRTPQTISNVYTQEGWSKYIDAGIKDACKDPYRIDWVIGTTKEQMPETNLDLDKLYNDMVSLYFKDVQEKWLHFIESVRLEPFGDIERCMRVLLKLGRDQSEFTKFFEKISELTQIKEVAKEVPDVPEDVTNAVNKAIAKKVRRVAKIKINTKSLLQKATSVKNLDVFFEPLRSFTLSDKGSLGGLEGYRDKIISLAEKISNLENFDGDNVVSLFNGKENDPLFNAWKYTHNELNALPEAIAHCIRIMLLAPIEYTGKAVSNVMVKQFNTLWHNDVYTIFSNRFAGKYPFIAKEDEALFNEVMDYFRPATGIFWGFYDRRLSAFIVKANKKWTFRTIGTIDIDFNPQILETLDLADKLKTIFFQPDGTLRVQKITLNSTKLNKNKGLLTVGENEFIIAPGGNGEKALFLWPIETGSNDISLKIYAAKSVAQDFAYKGEWGLMRLFEGARFNIINQNSFIAKWHINVQNVYTIKFVCRVNVTGADHPFVGRIFNNFECPPTLAILKN